MPALFPQQILPLLYEAGSSPHQSSKLQHRLQRLTEEASQICGQEIQVGTPDLLLAHEVLVALVLRMRDVVSPGSHVSPGTRGTEAPLCPPRCRRSRRRCWTGHTASAQPWCAGAASGTSWAVPWQSTSTSRTTSASALSWTRWSLMSAAS